jgi:hypothetical protein
MTLSWIPKPPERAARIASEAAQRVQVDEESLRPAVRELMRRGLKLERVDDALEAVLGLF